MHNKLSRAGRDGGWLLAILLSIVALSFAAITNFNVAKETAEFVASVPGGGVESPCPKDWEYMSFEVDTAVQRICRLNDITVVLTPDGQFDYAVPDVGGSFIFEESEVPGWLNP